MNGCYAVTGSQGFIGSRLASALTGKGATVIGLPTLLDVRAILDPEFAPRGKLDGIFHLGAISSTTEQDTHALLGHNVNCTDGLYQWCWRNEVPFVYASSAAVYGDGAYGFDDRWGSPLEELRPLSPYAWSKWEADKRLASLTRAGIEPPRWYGCRIFNCYGPGEEGKKDQASYPHKAIHAFRNGTSVKLFKGSEEYRRDFVHVDDVVDVMLWLMDEDNPWPRPASGFLNIGTGFATSFTAVLDMVAYVVRSPNAMIVDHVDMPDHLVGRYQRYTCAQLDRLQATHCPRPRPLSRGLMDFAAALPPLPPAGTDGGR